MSRRPSVLPINALLGAALLGAALLAACRVAPPAAAPEPADGSTVPLVLLETTDLHSHILGYDYSRDAPDPTLGFERVATLVTQARAEYPNTMLFDAGDTIQGTVLAEYQARVAPLPCDEELAMYRAMDALGYDGGTIGNHEFNFGLPYLAQVTGTPMPAAGSAARRCAGPHYPLVLSNVDAERDGTPLYRPWVLLTRTFSARRPDGGTQPVTLRIGLLGFTPPQIVNWDRAHLQGRVRVSGVVEAAQRWLPALQAQHPDLVVALIHGGPDAAPYSGDLENAAWHLAGVPGIDAILMGHMHQPFPGAFAALPDVDARRGRIRGVPAVMAGFWGQSLGLVHLDLRRERGVWQLDRAAAYSELRPICRTAQDCVAPDARIAPLVRVAHEGAVASLRAPIGSVGWRLSSYFAEVGDSSTLAVINTVQRDYVRDWIAREHPEWRDEPLLSAASAFKTGYAGAADYTDIAPGALSLRSAADLYPFSNQMMAVRIDGATLKRWMELSAQRFNRIDPADSAPQALFNERFPGFNFDQFAGDGLRYVIDPSRPVGARVTALTIDGKPVGERQMLIVATNSYRAAGSAAFPALDGSQTVLAAPDTVRELIADWLRRHPQLQRAQLLPRAWRFAPLHTRAPLTFVSAGGKAALAAEAGLRGVHPQQDLGDGRARYAIELDAAPMPSG
ncbi:bifunctional 2',3'-cyclic-nucleotide 2'-phosphodiesterase/3'-nucleotidase [Solimonas variicoloris]|uniref:bifunctional 2',3'-cyclic-nucleotide 2'-phosphodiesterase/3'-nucleotidase n=1 Tax=Solimonas variicoloris TaxID=254408 RepID=UPI00037DFC50|nr:bifunctional 2',3'-cyclic-nucleotide 2'-phosphodiesterase/3'-nucleotidase [Solimonas variicoloris]